MCARVFHVAVVCVMLSALVRARAWPGGACRSPNTRESHHRLAPECARTRTREPSRVRAVLCWHRTAAKATDRQHTQRAQAVGPYRRMFWLRAPCVCVCMRTTCGTHTRTQTRTHTHTLNNWPLNTCRNRVAPVSVRCGGCILASTRAHTHSSTNVNARTGRAGGAAVGEHDGMGVNNKSL